MERAKSNISHRVNPPISRKRENLSKITYHKIKETGMEKERG